MINKKFYESFTHKKIDVRNVSKEESKFINPSYLIPYLEFVKENIRVFKLIHDKPELFGNQKMYEKLYRELFSPILDKFNIEENKKQYILNFYTQGALSIIFTWIQNDCKDDIEFVSNIIMDLIKG